MSLQGHSRGSESDSQTFCPNVSPPLTGLGAVACERLHRLAVESSVRGKAMPTPWASVFASTLPQPCSVLGHRLLQGSLPTFASWSSWPLFVIFSPLTATCLSTGGAGTNG